jgi:hypothetical protein
LARDYEQLAETLAGLHFVAFAILMLKRLLREYLEIPQAWPFKDHLRYVKASHLGFLAVHLP